MPGKMVRCRFCPKVMRSDNLKNHIKTVHKGMEKEIPTFSGSEFDGAGKPKSKEIEKLRRLVDGPTTKEESKMLVDLLNKRQKKSKEESKKSLSELLQIDPNLLKIDSEEDSEKELEEQDADKLSGEEDSEDDDKNELEDFIQSTLEYLIKPEQDELSELIAEFEEKIEDRVVMEELKQLIDVFLVDEFYEGELILPQIHDIVRQLESSDMLKTKILRLKILIDNIARNRYRVKSILTRLNNAEDDDFTTVLKGLAQEGLLSPEEYDDLLEAGTLPEIVEIIKDTKVGEGTRFFPSREGGPG